MNPRKISSIRNALNILFIFLALAAMVGVVAFPSGSIGMTASYYVALFAVVLKMIEVCFRIPMQGKDKRRDEFRNH